MFSMSSYGVVVMACVCVCLLNLAAFLMPTGKQSTLFVLFSCWRTSLAQSMNIFNNLIGIIFG